MEALLLSNSTNFGEAYMAWCASKVASFVTNKSDQIIFIPFAGVGFSYEDYTKKVNQALQSYSVEVKGIHEFENKQEAIENASAIFIGGGNTFMLTKLLYDFNLLDTIRTKVINGCPYVGWSAGSNVAGKTICTTNDMPIVEPQSFKSLGLFPSQINPHFTNKTIPNHGGETRQQRLEEYLAANSREAVFCLPEASFVECKGGKWMYEGGKEGIKLTHGNSELIADQSQLSV